MKRLIATFALLALPALATVPSSLSRNTYTGNGISSSYVFTFPATVNTDVEVLVNNVLLAGARTITVNGNQTTSPGGTVLFNTPPLSGAAITIQRRKTITQGTSLPIFGQFPAKTVERTFDSLTYLIQQVDRDRADLATKEATDITAILNPPTAFVASNTLILPTGGTNSQTMADIAGRTLDVHASGALGNGTDDFAHLQAAVTAGGGKTVLFTSGTYGVSASIFPPSGTNIVCSGICTIQPANGFTGNLFEIQGINGFHFSGGFKISGFNQAFHALTSDDILIQGVSITGGTTGIGDIGSSSRIRVLDNIVSGTLGMGIDIEDSHDIVVSRNLILNPGQTILGGEGIAIRALVHPAFENDKIVISDNTLEDCGKACIKVTVETLFNGSQGSFAGSQQQRVSITGNTIHGWGTNVNEAGIAVFNHLCVAACGGETNQAISITGNVVESKGRVNPIGGLPWEISYIDAVFVNDATITGNIMRGGVTWSGLVLQGSNRVTVTGNVITDAMKNFAATGGVGGAGAITLIKSNYCTVTGNTITNPGKVGDNHSGIYAESSQHNTFSANVITDTTPGTLMGYGIEMNTAGAIKDDFNSIVGNSISGFVTAAITFGGLQQHQRAIANVGDSVEAADTVTYTSGATSRALAHTLGVIPTRVKITPLTDTGASTKWWVDLAGANSSNIVIHMSPDPAINVTWLIETSTGFR